MGSNPVPAGNQEDLSMSNIRVGGYGLRAILLIVAVIAFVLAALGVGIGVDLVALGLAFFAGSFLAS